MLKLSPEEGKASISYILLSRHVELREFLFRIYYIYLSFLFYLV